MQHRKISKEAIMQNRKRPRIRPPQESKQNVTPQTSGPKFICCYPAAPLLKKYDDSGNYTMAGDLACHSELFMKVDSMGQLNSSPPYNFTRVGNVYQCALCGTMYRLMPDNVVLMLMRDRWLKVDPLKGIIYLADGTTKTVLFNVSDLEKSPPQEYIHTEEKSTINEGYSDFNI